MNNAVTPRHEDQDELMEEEFEEKEEVQRSRVVDCVCSIRFVIILLVISIVFSLVAVTATWSAIDITTMDALSTSLRKTVIKQVADVVTDSMQPVKAYGQLVLSGIKSGLLSPNTGKF
jgi:hypothetical protein